jgi:hypothetical protein
MGSDFPLRLRVPGCNDLLGFSELIPLGACSGSRVSEARD